MVDPGAREAASPATSDSTRRTTSRSYASTGSVSAAGLVDPEENRLVGIVGYPLNGPLDVEPGRIGRTEKVLTTTRTGKGPVDRTITSLSG